MTPVSKVISLPIALLLLLSKNVASQSLPTAVKKLPLDSDEKLLAADLAFAPLDSLTSAEVAHPLIKGLDVDVDVDVNAPNGASKHDGRVIFQGHRRESGEAMMRRAAQALAQLEKRTSCPDGMTGCDNIGSPNKCCPSGTYCTSVQDDDVGHVACCPNGATCGGGIGGCPAGATSCAADLGGGCCIPGYVCQGYGCIPSSAIATASQIVYATGPPITQTITTTRTTIVAGNPSVIMVTLTITQTAIPDRTTKTETKIVTPPGFSPTSDSNSASTSSGPSSATGVAPWRPTAVSSGKGATAASDSTQSGCPTGFYGCVAAHGGGCCRTERDCGVLSCPVPSSTIVTHGVTVVVPISDVPASATSACANGWFLCGKDAGPVAGCCPTGYSCGTASCFTVEATSTGQVQKEAPSKNAAAREAHIRAPLFGCVLGAFLFLLL